jgi:hypothetical protein
MFRITVRLIVLGTPDAEDWNLSSNRCPAVPVGTVNRHCPLTDPHPETDVNDAHPGSRVAPMLTVPAGVRCAERLTVPVVPSGTEH